MPDFQDLIQQRRDHSITREELRSRREGAPFGTRGMEWIERWLEVESYGNVGLALFDLPPIVERAQGDRLVDVDGKEYLDFLAGFGVSALGQCQEEVTEVIRDQAGTLTHYFDFPHPERIKMSERLSTLAPVRGDARVAYGVTGSDATELAIRAARYHTGKPMVLSAFGDYHGVTYGTMATTGKGGMQSYFYPVRPHDTGIGHFPFPYPYRSPFGEPPEGVDPAEFTLNQLESYLEYYFGSTESPYGHGPSGHTNVAAFLVSPMQCSAGYLLPSEGYLTMLRKFTDRYGILLIVDEIQAGLGRTGKLWATQWDDIEADMICTSKALGGGLPLSAVVGTDEILESWGPAAHVSTQAGNAVACAAGNHVLDTLADTEFLGKVREKGRYFTERLTELQDRYTVLGDLNTRGLFTGMELVRDRETKQPAPEAADHVTRRCLEEGMLFEQGGYFANRLQLIPPLTVRKETLDRAVEILDTVFAEVEEGL